MAEEETDRREHELEAAALLLLLERRARRALRKSVRVLTNHVGRLGGDLSYLDQAVRAGARESLGAIRGAARAGARQSWTSMTDLDVPPGGDLHAAGLDALRAQSSADSLARQWRAAAHANDLDVQVALQDLLWRLDRTATTETVDGWNAETQRLNDLAEALGFEITETWSAILDSRTCGWCRALDGNSIVRPERFADLPPLHPSCRCLVLTDVRVVTDRKAA